MVSPPALLSVSGQVKFVGEEGAGGEEARVVDAGSEEGPLAKAAGLLGVEAAALNKALCCRTVKVRSPPCPLPLPPACPNSPSHQSPLGPALAKLTCRTSPFDVTLASPRVCQTRNESYSVPMNPTQGLDARDALSKEVYNRLFGWLVARINASTAVAHEAGSQHRELRTIGLLDIFGFESFQVSE